MGPGTKAGIRAGSVSNGHSYASWVAHLATLHLGAAHVSIVEAAGIAAAVQAGMIDLAIGPRDTRTGNYEVKQGLASGDIVMRNPGSTFKEGQTVQLAPGKVAAAPAAVQGK